MTVHATLCFIVQEDKILLIKKKRGFGEGKFNGAGGKLNPNESYLDCVRRELIEEIGVDPVDPICRGELKFYFGEKDVPDWKVMVFTANDYKGSLVESEEAKPHWFKISEIPFDKMWEDDVYWLPKILRGKTLSGDFLFSEDMNQLLYHKIREIKIEC